MPRYTVTVLRHQWAQITVTATDEDAAMDLVIEQAKQGAVAISTAPWETTLIDPVEVEPAGDCEACANQYVFGAHTCDAV